MTVRSRFAGWASALLLGSVGLAEAGVLRSVTDPRDGVFETTASAIDAAGTAVFFSSASAHFGSSARPAAQIVRCGLPAGACVVLTSFDDGVIGQVSVSDDGQWLVFASTSDPLGQNHDESMELFVMHPDGSGLLQLTHDPSASSGQIRHAVLSASGSRILFVAATDPLGTNPTHSEQLFIVERDGSNLRQLTVETEGEFFGTAISDDGQQIAFGHESLSLWRILAINPDGTDRRQLYSSAADISGPAISGDGSTVAFNGATIGWNGEGLNFIAGGHNPVLSSDAKFLWLAGSDGEIYLVNVSTHEATRLTFSSGAIENDVPVVSGSGNRIVFRARGGAHPGGDNPDGGDELMTMDESGGNLRQLTVNENVEYDHNYLEITSDGTRIVFESRLPTIGNIYRIQADGSDLVTLTDIAPYGAYQPSVSGDGNTIVFATFYPNWSATIHRVFADGTGLLQLSTSNGNEFPQISTDGTVVVYKGTGGYTLYRVAPDGSGLTAIAEGAGPLPRPRPTDTGEWVVFHGACAGLEPLQVRRVRADGTDDECLTSDPDYYAWLPDTSGDGEWIVYPSGADPLGTNPDHNSEIFSYRPATAERRQLTVTTTGQSDSARISGNGAWVYFRSSAPLFDAVVGAPFDVYRVSPTGGPIERVTGLRAAAGTGFDGFAVNDDGNRVAFAGTGSPSDENPDGSHEIFLADYAAAAGIRISRGSPTVVAWDPEPRPVRYDVIRGDVAQLQLSGGVVALGSVACLEDDSPDAHTAGHGDALDPAAGQAFFFLHRGTQGAGDGPGSWGQGSGGFERVAGAGVCPP